MSLRVRLGTSLFFLVFIAIGCYPLYLGVQGVRKAQATRTWPTTPGRITRSQVRVETNRSRDDKGREKVTHSYYADVDYAYEVDGKQHTGHNITVMGSGGGSRGDAEAILARYPLEATVTVAYNPQSHDDAVLEPGKWGSASWLLVFAGLFMGVPLLMLRGVWMTPKAPVTAGGEDAAKSASKERELSGLVFKERILKWEPGRIVHLHRDHETLYTIVVGSLVVGMLFGLFVGLIPAAIFFSQWGGMFLLKAYLVVSGLIAVAFGIAFGWAHRRRDFLFDWGMNSLRAQMGWQVKQYALQDIQELVLRFAAPGAQEDAEKQLPARVDMRVAGVTYVPLETSFRRFARDEVRQKLLPIVEQLAKELQVPWSEKELIAEGTASSTMKADVPYTGEYASLVSALEQVGGRVYCDDNEVQRVDLSEIQGTDGIVEIVAQFPTIQELTVTGREISDAAADHIAQLSKLCLLSLNNTSITDAGVARLTKLENLESLSLNGTHISNDAVRYLGQMEGLDELELAGTAIDDQGLLQLLDLPNMYSVNLRGTRVSAAGVRKLRETFPDCEVIYDEEVAE